MGIVSADNDALRRQNVYILLLTLISCSVYLWVRLHCGWLPEDDGLLGQSALRVFHGQLPHVDFAENYTGGLAYIHAAAFTLFGVNAFSMRIALFALSVPFLLAVFYIASRTSGAKTAAIITVLAAVWSIAVYSTPMPSWYNLYFAVFGAAALIRFIDDGRRRWLVLAGIAGGISFDIKVVGLYYIAGVLLFLLFREQEMSAASLAKSKRTYIYSAFVIGGLIFFVAGVWKLVGGNLQEGDAFHFLLPSAAMAALLVRRELCMLAGSDRHRFSTLLRMVLPFLAGCAGPVVVVLWPYMRGGNLPAFIQGVFILGMSRAHDLTQIHAKLPELGLALPPLVFLLMANFWKPLGKTLSAVSAAVVLAVALALALWSSDFSKSIFYSVSMMTPWVIAFGAWMLASERAQELSSNNRQQAMLLVGLAALCSLIQFPFPVAVYFCYFAPILALAILALLNIRNSPIGGSAAMALLVFYVLFGLLRVVPSNMYEDGEFQTHSPQTALHLERAGGIKTENPGEYENLIRSLQSHARNSYVFAEPECPDIYFFSGLENPSNNDGGLPPAEVEALLARDDVYAIVFNRKPYFSKLIDAGQMQKKYESRFPHMEVFGKYLLMWR